MSPKSFNNDIGVPLTIFNHDPNTDFLVLEVGTNHHGELKVLSDMTSPDVAVITSISHEHLEGLSDLNGVRREEASIISGLKKDGLLVVNGDDPELMPHLAPWKGKRVTFGFGTHNDLFATNVRLSGDGTVFNLNGSRREVYVPLLGKHSATNALAALAVARRLGVDEDQAIEALAVAKGPEMRQQLLEVGGVRILNDAYNANPASMRSAFETFLALPKGKTGRRLAVLGEMRELGDASDELHRQLGRDAAGLDVDGVVFVGRQARLSYDAAIESGLGSDSATWFSDAASAGTYLSERVVSGDLVLLKGSRGVRLEGILDALQPVPSTGRRIA
jgi:UDP-N-acetylmuramoyl-tripeptide--D-alanyl-D-alanine ligase